jgi:hypothetical protein
MSYTKLSYQKSISRRYALALAGEPLPYTNEKLNPTREHPENNHNKNIKTKSTRTLLTKHRAKAQKTTKTILTDNKKQEKPNRSNEQRNKTGKELER